MKILVTGGNGQVGSDLKKLLQQTPIEFFAPNRTELNISDEMAVKRAIKKYSPDVVINLAAYTQVDRAESEWEKAVATNYSGVRNLSLACKTLSCLLIQVSTDYVFDGETSDPYKEEDKAQPVNAYGKSKLLAEELIANELNHFIILRVSAVFGTQGQNFVKTILRLAQEKKELNVINDQFTCPTPSINIAETLIELTKNPQSGIFHYCGEQTTNWYDFAKKIIEIGGEFKNFSLEHFHAVSASAYHTAAQRPRYSVLNCHKIKNTFGISQPNWEEGLRYVIQQL